MTAPEPNHSPISAAGGGEPAVGGAAGDRPQHPGGAAQLAEPLDPHRVSVTEN